MVATNLKLQTVSLVEKRESLESEMNEIIARLSQPGGPGISGSLLDSEGFPRSDIDIPAVRLDRHRLSELRNDHKDITDKINENLQLLHSARLPQNVSLSSRNLDSPSAMDEEPITRVPFAMVDEIAEASPAAEDGLQLGDQIAKFGNVESGDGLLPRLASEAQSNQGRAIPLVIMRQGTVINLTVTPRPWNGQGLLGCHFRIL